MTKPAYRDRHPGPRCQSGYLDCAQLWVMSLRCCVECAHPGRAEADPAFTPDEIADMWRRQPHTHSANTTAIA